MITIEKFRVEELPFVALEDKQSLPQEPCVYFVLDGQGTVLYIGQSENLKERWSSHHKLAAMMQLEGVKISFLKTDVELLRRVEIALIEAFNPPLNEVLAKTRGIAKLRERAGLTQKDVATAVGVDISTVRNWEYGKGTEMFVRVVKLCKALDCQPGDLLEEGTHD